MKISALDDVYVGNTNQTELVSNEKQNDVKTANCTHVLLNNYDF